MKHARKPQWMEDFKSVHGIYPIAGGSDDNPPEPENQPGTLTVEDPPPPPEKVTDAPAAKDGFQQGSQEGFLSEEEVARRIADARKEEKDKLYGRLSEKDEELRRLREEEQARQREIAEREEAEAAEAKRRAEEEMDVRELLTTKEQEWQQRFHSMEEELQRRDAMLEREREFQALEAYKQQRLAEHEEFILPELRDQVRGNTPEEVDASISSLQETSASILANVQAAQQQQRMQQPGPRVTAPAMGPLEQNESTHQTFTAADIRDMSMDEYRTKRDQFLQAVRNKTRTEGPYGGV